MNLSNSPFLTIVAVTTSGVPYGHAAVDEDQESLSDLTNLLAAFFFPNDLDDFCPGMNGHPKFLLHQTEMAFVGSKQMKEIVWMR